MPELPEVELTRRRLEPEVVGKHIARVEVRTAKLRLPLPAGLATALPGRVIRAVERRGKYLLFDCGGGWLIIHLGMTGFLRFFADPPAPGKHDHLDIVLGNGAALRFHDPRKFGAVAWTGATPALHPLLAGIGPEPLTAAFDGEYLFEASRRRRRAVKQLLMDAQVVAGVGNIYANEALFGAGIRPDRPAGALTAGECDRLALVVKEVLAASIREGSTWRVAEETVAYHPLEFKVYGRGGERCTRCGGTLAQSRLGSRGTVFCPGCQR